MLREAGVVDAGGYGLTVLLAGIVGGLRGSDPPPLDHQAAARVTHPQHASSTYRYCTNFAVTGTDLEQRAFVPALELIGDSVLVVGDATTLKIHVHTDDPNAATRVFADAGVISHLDVADMREQVQQRDARLAAAGGARHLRCARRRQRRGDARAVREPRRPGDRRWSDAQPLDLRPARGDPRVPAEQVVVLPNSPNVFMAAERAAELSDKQVSVVLARSQQAGLAAAVSLDPERGRGRERRRDGPDARARPRRRGRPAARDDAQGRFHSGDAVGFVEEEIVVWGTPRARRCRASSMRWPRMPS